MTERDDGIRRIVDELEVQLATAEASVAALKALVAQAPGGGSEDERDLAAPA